MKPCFKCGCEKPLTDFYKHKKMPDGHLNKCKECTKKDVSSNYRKNIEHYKEYERKRARKPDRVKARSDYSKTEAGKAAHKKSCKKWVERNPVKRLANIMVGNAVASGKLEKPDNCESCGIVPRRIHGHHDDYAKPLDVRWLCPGCHSKWHRENGEGANAR